MTDRIIRPRADMDRRTMRIPALAVLLAAAFVPAATSHAGEASPRRQAVPRQDLRAQVDEAVRSSGLAGASVAVSVVDIATGNVLLAQRGDEQLIPASNMKVLTTGAALHVLGPSFEFRTRMVRSGDCLTVVGDGDPSFGDPAFLAELIHVDAAGAKRKGLSAEQLVDLWAQAARRAGVTAAREVVVDDRVFDREFVHPSWPADQLDNSYCAQVAGLNFHENVLLATVGADGGRPAVLKWDPPAPWLRAAPAANATVNAQGKKAPDFGFRRDEADPGRFVLWGNLRLAKGAPPPAFPICVRDMPAFFARFVAARLAAAGIAVGAARTASAADPPAGDGALGPAVRMSIAKVIERCNEESQNMYAESLLKRMGAARTGKPGSWASGCEAVAAAIAERLGPQARAAYVGSDGSGLSRGNRVTANLLARWIASLAADPALGAPFVASLAQAGHEGTVQKRFDAEALRAMGAEIHCKTGYINGVSCLSGCAGPAGATPRYAFSVLCNDLGKVKDGIRKAKDLQERVAMALAKGG
jgi:D-alanyl-D-alanine carboxypeptidase/D-alanyl-D-alanine-endopeptidase (penicillin-binding protein 4)